MPFGSPRSGGAQGWNRQLGPDSCLPHPRFTSGNGRNEFCKAQVVSFLDTAKLPLSLKGMSRDEVATQYGALCYRIVRGKIQVLLVTSRTRRRWIVPKGWPIKRTPPAEGARIEAWEEAGVRGKVSDTCVGIYGYTKLGERKGTDQPCMVAVFPLKVKSLARKYPERHQRRRKWVSPKQASRKVAEPELRKILKDFDPSRL